MIFQRIIKLLAFFIFSSLNIYCSTQVTSMKEDQDLSLGDETGYMLLTIETNRGLNKIELNGKGVSNIELNHQDLRLGSNYILSPVPAGQYRLSKVDLSFLYYLKLKKGDWDFEIEPNKINYVGHLAVRSSGWFSEYFEIVMLNKSSQALEYLENNFPNILESRAIVYSGPGEDDFFQWVEQFDVLDSEKSKEAK